MRTTHQPWTLLGILIFPLAAHLLAFALLAQNPWLYAALPGAEGRAEALQGTLAYYRGGPAPGGFTEAELSHLADVRVLFRLAYLLAPLSILLLVALLALGNAKAILKWGGLLAVLLPLIAVLIPFKALFTAFPAALFEPGTWMFPLESRLLQLFPEGFFRLVGTAMGAFGAFLGAACFCLSVHLPNQKL
jgi:hypothetical protein